MARKGVALMQYYGEKGATKAHLRLDELLEEYGQTRENE